MARLRGTGAEAGALGCRIPQSLGFAEMPPHTAPHRSAAALLPIHSFTQNRCCKRHQHLLVSACSPLSSRLRAVRLQGVRTSVFSPTGPSEGWLGRGGTSGPRKSGQNEGHVELPRGLRYEGKGLGDPRVTAASHGPGASTPNTLLPSASTRFSLFLPLPSWPFLLDSAPTLLTSMAQN